MKPIYVQIAEWLETEILQAHIKENEKMYSQYQLADMFQINPATAAKGLNLLVTDSILYKKRGLGMFVTENARERIMDKRKEQLMNSLIWELVLEAERLQLDEDDLLHMIKTVKNQQKEEGKQ